MQAAQWGRGGSPVAGATVGLMLLDTDFARPPGDGGNLLTWDFPVLTRVVRGVGASDAVVEHPETVLSPFSQAAQGLVADGAAGVVANCGFLVPLQRALAWAAGVPVLTSALQQLPVVEAMLPPGQRAGVLTISAERLTARHLEAAGGAPDTPVAGLDPAGPLAGAILGGGANHALDPAAAEAEMVAIARGLIERVPEVGALVLECTNMPPYARAVAQATGLPVFSFVTAVRWFHAALRPPVWPDS